MPDHGHPISSPCEPNGSDELKIGVPLHIPVQFCYIKVVFKRVYITRTCFYDAVRKTFFFFFFFFFVSFFCFFFFFFFFF